MFLKISPLAIGVLLTATALSAEASLTSYTGAEGVGLVYSSVSDVTWTQDANLLGTMAASQGYSNLVDAIIAASPIIYDTPNVHDGSYSSPVANSGQYSVTTDDFNSSGSGLTTWFGAQAFIGYLNSINYGGSNQWALPSAGSNPQLGHNVNDTAFDQLFYNELGVTEFSNISETLVFNNIYSTLYWFDTEYAPFPGSAWSFSTSSGIQIANVKYNRFSAWAVSPGQVSAVPVPGAVWLFWTGLLGLLGLKRCYHTR